MMMRTAMVEVFENIISNRPSRESRNRPILEGMESIIRLLMISILLLFIISMNINAGPRVVNGGIHGGLSRNYIQWNPGNTTNHGTDMLVGCVAGVVAAVRLNIWG
jgi:hypothetical protein